MSIMLNLLRSILFFALVGHGFQSMSDDGSFSLPLEAIEKHRLATAPIASPPSVQFLLAKSKTKLASSFQMVSRATASMYDPVEALKKKETLVAKSYVSHLQKKNNDYVDIQPSNICAAVKSNRGLDFKTPTSYLSSVLKKAGAVEKSEPLFKDHADLLWKNYLSKNNFEDISSQMNSGDFNFNKLKNGTLIVLEKSCFKKGTVAVYCDGQYFATTFVKTEPLLKKINSQKSGCQLGSGMRIVVERTAGSTAKPETLAKAY